MIKRIPIKQLREGMYIQELITNSWLQSPFFKKSFPIDAPDIIEQIKEARITEVMIDTEKGVDVLDVISPPLQTSESVNIAPPPSRSLTSQVSQVSQYASIPHVSMEDELGQAAKIVGRSKAAVVSMFSEVRMGKAINAEQAIPLVEEIAGSVMRNPGALLGLARLKTADDYTYMHSVAVCGLMIALARQLQLGDEEIRQVGLAGLLHDVGKMSVDKNILNKPGKLTDGEFVAIKQHPKEGYDILKAGGGVGEIPLDVCLHHHEKVDGSGYPDRLVGEQISIYAKMGAVCDVYDAITSNRPYKTGWCPAESIRKMTEWSKGHFDDKIFQAFVKSVGIYPVGTLVKLQTGRLAVVVEQQPHKSLLLPMVRVFFSTKSQTYISPQLIDLSSPSAMDKIVSREEANAWGLKDINRYWLGDNVA